MKFDFRIMRGCAFYVIVNANIYVAYVSPFTLVCHVRAESNERSSRRYPIALNRVMNQKYAWQ